MLFIVIVTNVIIIEFKEYKTATYTNFMAKLGDVGYYSLNCDSNGPISKLEAEKQV